MGKGGGAVRVIRWIRISSSMQVLHLGLQKSRDRWARVKNRWKEIRVNGQGWIEAPQISKGYGFLLSRIISPRYLSHFVLYYRKLNRLLVTKFKRPSPYKNEKKIFSKSCGNKWHLQSSFSLISAAYFKRHPDAFLNWIQLR